VRGKYTTSHPREIVKLPGPVIAHHQNIRTIAAQMTDMKHIEGTDHFHGYSANLYRNQHCTAISSAAFCAFLLAAAFN
ncbi:TPA: hypothetical protein ACNGZD_003930, partial [Escherichia coli]